MEKTKFIYRTQFKLQKSGMEKTIGESKTIPDEHMTIADVVLRFANGVQLGLDRAHYYHDTDDLDFEDDPRINLDHDLTDIDEQTSKVGLLKERVEKLKSLKKATEEKQENHEEDQKINLENEVKS